jgi:arylsulfatase A-like enzyme
VQYADRLFGDFIAALKGSGAYNEAVIIMTADHGLRLGRVRGSETSVDQLMTHIPLIVRAPGLIPGRSAVAYQHTDFGSVVFSLLSSDEGPDGRSGVAFESVRGRQRSFLVADKWQFVETHDTQWVYEEVASSGSRSLTGEHR